MKLSELVTEYVSLKQSIGMCYRSDAVVLRSFCKAMGNMRIEEYNPNIRAAFLAGEGPITTFWHRKYEPLWVLSLCSDPWSYRQVSASKDGT